MEKKNLETPLYVIKYWLFVLFSLYYGLKSAMVHDNLGPKTYKP